MADEERGGVRQWMVGFGSVLAMLPVLYVLSIGPAMRWAMRGGNVIERFESLQSFYAPLGIVMQKLPWSWCWEAVRWYMDLWLP
jgi:hypothetical protein